jgi:hypothetical protein
MDLQVIAKHIKAIQRLYSAIESAEKAIHYHAKLIGIHSGVINHPPVNNLSPEQIQMISDYIESFKFLYPHKLSPKFPASTIGLRTDR